MKTKVNATVKNEINEVIKNSAKIDSNELLTKELTFENIALLLEKSTTNKSIWSIEAKKSKSRTQLRKMQQSFCIALNSAIELKIESKIEKAIDNLRLFNQLALNNEKFYSQRSDTNKIIIDKAYNYYFDYFLKLQNKK